MLPVVAIVGRPNVGKSTLFNRLTRTRDALISAYPGTTRDRQYGEVELESRRFILIDTGGITEETDEVGKLITHQATQAIEDADKILFLIDGQAGVTPEDKMIAEMLRRTGKPIYLAVNKTEGQDPALSVAEAYELGMEAPIAIAAVHGSGIARLIEQLFPDVMEEQPAETEEAVSAIKLAIVGRPNVGKSTLTNRLLGEERVIVHDMPGTTRDSIFIPLERFDKHYTLIDTAGIRKRKKISEVPEKFSVVKTLQAIENANVVLYVIDARIGVSEQDMKLLGFVLDCGKALVIAINKWDGMTEEAREHARATIDRHLDFVRFARVHFISALHGSGVGNLFDSIDEAYESATKKLSTPILTRLLEKALVTHSPPLVHGHRVKLRYAHPGGHNPPTIVIHGNRVNALPDSYKRFLANYFQTKLKLYGTPVKVEFKSSENPFAGKKR
ncbi:ribosome biogenesis GTPase Der [Aquicella lusitana]|uniref:GTPase Der n=1 Tax=Aquicella lusitana TaxID=254246 RepID=A0A370GM38_9COXI|nr:ribosome biogenesis GTPase Der [Aquicella lusitana]RDI44802.1 GTP-binding protein [Aquicella lusitana]VVC72999.1 GTPase Der [Aquicella lusitana]